MSKKILGIGFDLAGLALLFVPGIGTALGIGAKLLGGAFTIAQAIGVGLTLAGNFLMGPTKPKGLSTGSMVEKRLTATLTPTEPRKIWLGITAGAADVRYQTFTGSNQEYLEMVVCHASHAVHLIDQLWLDNELAWTSGGGAQGRYVGYLTVDTRTEGNSVNGIAIDGTWTSTCTLTGCAYSHLKCKLTGISDKVSSPFASGVTSRMTFRGKGAKVYDPRLDSTVAGGSGSMRANDQTTWTWDDNASRNPALQEMFYELGWKIGGKLAVGKGVPPARLDLASYAVAANHCDESVTLAAGGTEPRYRSDGIVSEGDEPGAVRDNLCATMNAMLRDSGGKITLNVIVNDLATPVLPSGKAAFDANDVQGSIQWDQTPDLSSSFNIARGRMVDASDNGLYQPIDIPEVSLASNDGIDRIDSADLPFVQSSGQAQRLLKQRLQRNQYQGRLTFTGLPSFWAVSLGDVFPFTHPAFGWSAKLFRCAGQKINRMGATDMVAVEENAAIYAWVHEEAPAVTAGAPVVYNPLNHPLIQGITDAYNRSVDGPPQSTTFNYDYTGAAQSGEFSRDLGFKLSDTTGQITSGITWAAVVSNGTVNTVASGSSLTMSGSGTGTLTISSLGSATASVKVTATYEGQDYSKTFDLAQSIAAPPTTTTGGGGGGSTTLASQTSGFAAISSTSFAAVTGTILTGVVVPSGVSTVHLNATMRFKPVTSGGVGTWTIEGKWQKKVAGVWTDVDTSPATCATDVGGGTGGDPLFSDSGNINDSQTVSVSAGTYDFQFVARETSGTRVHNVTGNASVTT